MITFKLFQRAWIALALVFGGALALGVSSGYAAEPWWHVNTISAPASRPGGESSLVLEVSNLGDAFVNGFADPVKIVDTLPAGVVPTHIYPEGSGNGNAEGIGYRYRDSLHCAFAGRTLTCMYAEALLTYERFTIAMTVEMEPGAGMGVSEVSVSGGGAPPLLWRHRLALTGSVPAFGVENYEMAAEEEGGELDTQAGSHPFQLTSTLTFNTKSVPVLQGQLNREVLPQVQPVTLTKDLRFDIPPGLVGNPTPLPKCDIHKFLANACPINTTIGVASPIVASVAEEGGHVPRAETVPLFNLEPAVGEPARFGFISDVGAVMLDTSVRTGGDYGVVVTVSDIVENVEFIGAQVTFWGVPSDPRHDTSRGTNCLDVGEPKTQWEFSCPTGESPRPFLIMPTACEGPLRTSLEGDAWADAGQFTPPKEYTTSTSVGEPVAEDGCNRLDFAPSITAAPDGQQGSTPTGLTVSEHVDQEGDLNPLGLAGAAVKNSTVTLPVGVAINPAGADGLSACGLEQVGLQGPGEQSCPESSKIGTVEVHTPLLPNPLTGAAYLAEQYANPFASLIAMYIVVYDPVSGVRVKVAGEVKPNPVTGQLVSTFKETPQLPFEELALHFFGGSRAPLGTPAQCGSYTTTASIAPWSGSAPVASSSEFEITSGPGGSPCASPLPFDPSLTAGSLNIQAGAFTPFTMTMSREDGQQNLQAIQLKMPPGLSGLLTGVKLCGEEQADAGTCGPESLIGETAVSVGLGGNPYTVTGGKVYITGPYQGAPFGLSIVNPANAGPFHLGNVIVRAKIEVNPTTAALTITSDNEGPYKIPQLIDGIPLQIKHVNVTIDRPNFTFNPTNCSPMQITGGLSSTAGSTGALAVPFQVTNCASLQFAPKFAVSTSGRASRVDGTSLNVQLTYPQAAFGSQANIKQVKVELPRLLPSRLPTLQKACTAAQFNANPAGCPSASIVGHGKAITPLVPVPLEGPAYFVSNGGEAFPNLIVVLQGYGVRIDLVGDTYISKAGVTSSTFKTVPDAPVGSFELNLPTGPYSALTTAGNLCKAKSLVMPSEFLAQNGAQIHQNTKIVVTGCPTKHKKTAHKEKGKRKRKSKHGKR